MTQFGAVIATQRTVHPMKNAWIRFVGACILATVIYAYTAPLGKLESSTSNPADTHYNLMVQGFRAGQLSLKKRELPGLDSYTSLTLMKVQTRIVPIGVCLTR